MAVAAASIAAIAGGIDGAGIGRELVRRVYLVTLFEKREFGWAFDEEDGTTRQREGNAS